MIDGFRKDLDTMFSNPRLTGVETGAVTGPLPESPTPRPGTAESEPWPGLSPTPGPTLDFRPGFGPGRVGRGRVGRARRFWALGMRLLEHKHWPELGKEEGPHGHPHRAPPCGCGWLTKNPALEPQPRPGPGPASCQP